MLILAGLGLAAERVISHHIASTLECATALRRYKMGSENFTLNDKGFAVLGNALLLGYRVQAAGMWFGTPEERQERMDRRRTDEEFARGERQAAYEGRELREVLEFAGVLDDRLEAPFNVSGKYPPETFTVLSDRLNAVVNSDADIARLCLGDVEFPAAVAERYGIADALAAANAYEFRMPFARLGPTPLTRSIKGLVVDWFKDVVARDLDITPAAAAFIGWDGVRGRAEHRKPPSWEAWNSARARATQKEQGWLEGLRSKAERLILAPIVAEYQPEVENLDLAAQGKLAVGLCRNTGPDDSIFCNGVGALGTALSFANPSVPSITDDLIDRVFPSYGAAENKSWDSDADPRNFLYFAQAQIGWHAAREGWAICVAEDDILTGPGFFSWVEPARFRLLTEPGRIELPDVLGMKRRNDLDELARREIGADRLWFVLTRDLFARQELSSSKPGPKKGGGRHQEKHAATALYEFSETHPEARLLRPEALSFFMKTGFSGKAAGRIWDNGAPDRWKSKGAPKHGNNRLSQDDLSVFLQRRD